MARENITRERDLGKEGRPEYGTALGLWSGIQGILNREQGILYEERGPEFDMGNRGRVAIWLGIKGWGLCESEVVLTAGKKVGVSCRELIAGKVVTLPPC